MPESLHPVRRPRGADGRPVRAIGTSSPSSKERRDAAVALLNETPGIRCYTPNATFYLFPNVTGAMAAKGFTDIEDFRRAVLVNTGVSVCSRVHFGRPLPGETEQYVRLAYSGIDTAPARRRAVTRLKAYLADESGV